LKPAAHVQLSLEHAWENEVVREARYTFEDSSRHPKAAELKRSIGTSLELVVDHGFYPGQNVAMETDLSGSSQKVWPIQPGERVLLCSDGLIKERHDNPTLPYVSNEEIIETVLSFPPQKAVASLTEIAASRRVDDNVSVVILEPVGSKRHRTAKPGRRLLLNASVAVASLMIILLLAGSLLAARPDLFRSAVSGVVEDPSDRIVDLSGSTNIEQASNAVPASTLLSTPAVTDGIESDSSLQPAPIDFIPAAGLRVIPTQYQTFIVSGENLIHLPSEAGEMLLSIEDGIFEIQNPYGGSGYLEPLSGKGLMGIVYKHDPYSFEVHCLIGKCEVAGDVDGVRSLTAGEMSHVGSRGIPGEPDVADFGRFAALSDEVPTLTPTPSATATSTPTPTHTPTALATSTPTVGGTPDPESDLEGTLPAIAPFDPDGDGVLHDPERNLYDLCQDEIGSAGTCGCPE
ncbi:MAG: hypothetical protein AAF633_29010, partial [Chloroflexota bacterium]